MAIMAINLNVEVKLKMIRYHLAIENEQGIKVTGNQASYSMIIGDY